MNELRRTYFPLSLPCPRQAELWHCRIPYGKMPAERESSGIAVIHFRFPAPFPGVAGKRIAFFSDLHYTPEDSRLGEKLFRIMEELAPDIILCGGDITSTADRISLLPPLLKRFPAIAPCLMIPGNWERGKRWLSDDFWKKLCKECGWRWLSNEGFDTGDFFFWGCDDPGWGEPTLPEKIPSPRLNFLLAHRPDTIIALDWCSSIASFDFALCGHTHGGQFRLPFFGPLYASSFYGCKFASGLFRRGGIPTRMIVSAGVNGGTSRGRFNCRREILLISFERA